MRRTVCCDLATVPLFGVHQWRSRSMRIRRNRYVHCGPRRVNNTIVSQPWIADHLSNRWTFVRIHFKHFRHQRCDGLRDWILIIWRECHANTLFGGYISTQCESQKNAKTPNIHFVRVLCALIFHNFGRHIHRSATHRAQHTIVVNHFAQTKVGDFDGRVHFVRLQ